MSIHKMRLSEQPDNNISFSHQQSVNRHYDPKYKKKSSLYQKALRTPNYIQNRTDQRELSAVLRKQQINTPLTSVNLAHSVSKLSRGKTRNSNQADSKKTKKGKHAFSVINLSKYTEEPKGRGSSKATKRKQSFVNLGDKIKLKVQDYQILANCLQQYVNEERRNNSEANLNQILKIICAFNRSQIAPLSKPLQTLIGRIIHSIQFSLPQTQPHLKSILKKSISFSSPSKQNIEEQGDEVTFTVKKGVPNKQYTRKQQEITYDVKTLQQNLSKLKYESERLKYFFEQMARKDQQIRNKNMDPTKLEQDRIKQLKKLREIEREQARIIRELQHSDEESQGTFRSNSPI